MRQLKGMKWSVMLLACLACGDDAALSSSDDPSSGADGGTIASGAKCATRYETKACSCDALKGAQYCTATGWSDCECQLPSGGTVTSNGSTPSQDGASTPAGNLRTDIHFDWERTPRTEGSCEPGYYEGTFQGLYASNITFVGAPIPVFALGTPGHPGLSFTLTKKAGGGEKLVIENGKMDGTADGAFPFIGTLTGTLDCDTLEFNAILDGHYSLGVDGVGIFKFKGPLIGKYDKATRSVVMATWDVDEYDPPPLNPDDGGYGDWNATWIRP
jgi:hypothetical protein